MGACPASDARSTHARTLVYARPSHQRLQPGKSLYTTVRELVENALDAAESISVLPEISVTIEELTEAELNALRGVESRVRQDLGLCHKAQGKGVRGSCLRWMDARR